MANQNIGNASTELMCIVLGITLGFIVGIILFGVNKTPFYENICAQKDHTFIARLNNKKQIICSDKNNETTFIVDVPE